MPPDDALADYSICGLLLALRLLPLVLIAPWLAASYAPRLVQLAITACLVVHNQPADTHLLDASTHLWRRQSQLCREHRLIDARPDDAAKVPKNLQFRFAELETLRPMRKLPRSTAPNDRRLAHVLQTAADCVAGE